MEELYELNPFSLKKADKDRILCAKYKEITRFHYDNCLFFPVWAQSGAGPRAGNGGLYNKTAVSRENLPSEEASL